MPIFLEKEPIFKTLIHVILTIQVNKTRQIVIVQSESSDVYSSFEEKQIFKKKQEIKVEKRLSSDSNFSFFFIVKCPAEM